jgi:hypothetical protein
LTCFVSISRPYDPQILRFDLSPTTLFQSPIMTAFVSPFSSYSSMSSILSYNSSTYSSS